MFCIAVGVVGLHIVDDNFLQPEPGTSPGDHLASGLIPDRGTGGYRGWIYPRLRAGAAGDHGDDPWRARHHRWRAQAVYYLLDGSASGDHFTGLLAIVAGVALPSCSHPSRSGRHGARTEAGDDATFAAAHRRWRRRSCAWAIVWFLVFPIGFAYIYTHTGRAAVTPDLGVPYETVTWSPTRSTQLARFVRPLERTVPRSFSSRVRLAPRRRGC